MPKKKKKNSHANVSMKQKARAKTRVERNLLDRNGIVCSAKTADDNRKCKMPWIPLLPWIAVFRFTGSYVPIHRK